MVLLEFKYLNSSCVSFHVEIGHNLAMSMLKIFLFLSIITSCELFNNEVDSSSNSKKPTEPEPTEQTRSFYLGFTPWPYAATLDAINNTYAGIASNGDMIAHHLDGGVPWPESLTDNNFDNYPTDLKNEVNGRVSRLESHQTVYLGVSPFNALRDDIALYWDNSGTNQPLPSPWDTLDLGSSFTRGSFTLYTKEMIEKFSPKYVNFGIEINEFYHNVPAQRDNLVGFVAYVYQVLKPLYPEIKFMVSFVMKSPGSQTMTESAELFNRIKDYIDMVGISVYPYAFFDHSDKGDPANLPTNWLSQIKDIAPGKPYFVAETGFVGEDLSIPAFGLNVSCDEDKQDLYVQKLFEESNELDIEGIAWFSLYDFDDLWNSSLGDDLSLIWRDTGLYDGNENPRKALSTWQQWNSYEREAD